MTRKKHPYRCGAKPYDTCEHSCKRLWRHRGWHRIPTLEWGWVTWIFRGQQPDVKISLKFSGDEP